jgi:hypothetical protein
LPPVYIIVHIIYLWNAKQNPVAKNRYFVAKILTRKRKAKIPKRSAILAPFSPFCFFAKTALSEEEGNGKTHPCLGE